LHRAVLALGAARQAGHESVLRKQNKKTESLREAPQGASSYFVYILECADGSLYTGITTDVVRRFDEHARGVGGAYTHSHGAKIIVYAERHPNRSEASKREAEIKKLTRTKKLMLADQRKPQI